MSVCGSRCGCVDVCVGVWMYVGVCGCRCGCVNVYVGVCGCRWLGEVEV